MHRFVFLLAAGALATTAAGQTVFRSGPAPVALIELFTSEGCSSCPPAEKWLAELRSDAGLWKTFVPVAFHVNYWDHLGWRDALAAKQFTDREHAYADAWRADSVYTPCFVRSGAEWRPNNGTVGASARDSAADAGTLTLTWHAENNTGTIEYVPAAGTKAPRALEASLALLGGGIVSNVRKGENAGRELRHEFVALRFETVTLKQDSGTRWIASVTLSPRTEINAPRRALAGWITAKGQLAPIQAAGGWLE